MVGLPGEVGDSGQLWCDTAGPRPDRSVEPLDGPAEGGPVTSFPENYYTTDAFTDHAIETITRSVKENRDQPFFHHITYTAPHYPLHAKPKDIAKYKGKFMMGWEKMREQRYQRQIEMGLIDRGVLALGLW